MGAQRTAILPPLVPVLFLFFLSGAGALVYEILWQRQLILVLGAASHATTAILSAFFLGLALGGRLGDRLLPRFRRPLVLFAAAEAWIALGALAVPALLAAGDLLYVRAWQALSPGPAAGWAVRFILAVGVVLVPTLGMGATIPAMNRVLVERGLDLGRGAGRAYGANAAGSFVGCLAAGIWLLPALGMRETLLVGMGLNGCAVAGSLLLLAVWKAPSPFNAGRAAPSPHPFRGAFLSLYALQGGLVLAFEAAWLRVLTILETGGVLTFTFLLGAVLAGFATGGGLFYGALARRLSPPRILAVSCLGTAGAALLLIPAAAVVPALTEKWLVSGVGTLPYPRLLPRGASI